ncbi:TPA: hypothetical protein R7C62_002699 [Klebsiella pneumoniae]|nr:hypothetical protein [Klebsiella pneumoniae]HEE3724981.1 hypothetical protein [Klebsiella pneumoniae]
MSFFDKVMFNSKESGVNEERTMNSVVENMKLLLSERSDLKNILVDFESGKFSQEEFVAICTTEFTKELLSYRLLERKNDMQAW